MKTAIIGSRNFTDYKLLKEYCSKFDITEVISGGARGADSLAENYAKENNIKLTVFPADWKKFGKSAGFIRNKDIIDNADFVIAFWDGESKGTLNSINIAKSQNKKVDICFIVS